MTAPGDAAEQRDARPSRAPAGPPAPSSSRAPLDAVDDERSTDEAAQDVLGERSPGAAVEPARPRGIERIAGEVPRQLLAMLVTPLAIPVALVAVARRDAPALVAYSAVGVAAMAIIYTGVYLFLTWLAFRGCSGDALRRRVAVSVPRTRAKRIAEAVVTGGEFGIPVLAVVTGLLLVIALIANPTIRTQEDVTPSAWVFLIALWALMITAFSAAYLRRWALRDDVVLPRTPNPRYGDFVYIAVQVGTTFSTSDVEITSTGTRWVVTCNSVIAFVFNTVLVSMLISIALSAL